MHSKPVNLRPGDGAREARCHLDDVTYGCKRRMVFSFFSGLRQRETTVSIIVPFCRLR
jgi:hypothetical protein